MKFLWALLSVCLYWTPYLISQQETVGPGPRQAHLLVYDEHLRKVILPTLEELWSWDGNYWKLLPGSGAKIRTLSSSVYDAHRKKLVLFGGRDTATQEVKGDTWEWNGKRWQRMSAATADIRDHHAMAYDAARGQTVLFGGATSSQPGSTWENNTWTWDGRNWTQVATEGPSGRISSLVYDGKNKQVVLFGGAGAGSSPQTRPYYNDTWVWNGKQWRQVSNTGPAGRYAHSLAFDRRAGVVVLYSGFKWREQLQDMWQWDGQRWTEIKLTGPTPGPRSAAAMVYDESRGRIVLHGGQVERQILGDTWEWDGQQWAQVQ